MSWSAAESLHQETQLLLQAAECLDPSSSIDAPSTAWANDSDATKALGSQLQLHGTPRDHIDSIQGTCSSNSRCPYPHLTRGCFTANADTPRMTLVQPTSSRRLAKYSEKRQHASVCLWQVGQFIPPDRADRVRGSVVDQEKRISCGLESSMDDLDQELMSAFPRLRHGGRKFLKLDEARLRQLSGVPPPTGGYSTLCLKVVVKDLQYS